MAPLDDRRRAGDAVCRGQGSQLRRLGRTSLFMLRLSRQACCNI